MTLFAAGLALLPIFSMSMGVGGPLFVDRSVETGTDILGFGKGAAMVDLDGDGRMDLVAVDHILDNTYLRQLSNHSFEDAGAAWGGPFANAASWGVLATDFDNDGDNDVYLLNGGFVQDDPNQMLRNDIGETGGFADMGAATGDANLSRQTHGGTAFDYDRDGDLDIFCSNDLMQTCTLLRNDGALVFEDVSEAAGVTHPGQHRHCTSGDYDNDGWLDVGVGNAVQQGGGNRLYHNQGDGTFVDVAPALGVDAPLYNFGMVFEDFDNDGWMDLYIPKYISGGPGSSLLVRNAGDGTFTDGTTGSGATGQTDMGHNTYDVDADGIPEIYIGTGNPHFEDYDLLWGIRTAPGMNGPTFKIEDRSVSSGIQSAGQTRCHGMAFGDYDEDGDIDIYVNNGGMGGLAEQMEENLLWQNQGGDNHWLAVGLRGTLSNRSGVGTRGAAHFTDGSEVHRYTDVGRGFANTNSPTMHFGFGSQESIQRVELLWSSGVTQTLLAPTVDERIDVVETGLRLWEPAVLGSTIELEACGPAGYTADVFLGAQSTYVPLPNFGGVLELAVPLFVSSLALDANGLAELPIQVPTTPSLSGLVLHLQAFTRNSAFQDATLTNRVELAFE